MLMRVLFSRLAPKSFCFIELLDGTLSVLLTNLYVLFLVFLLAVWTCFTLAFLAICWLLSRVLLVRVMYVCLAKLP